MTTATWRRVLVTLLGGCELLLALAAPAPVAVVGIAGAVLLVAAGWLPAGRAWRIGLTTLAVVPFAVLTWTGLVGPLVAVTALLLAAPSVVAPARPLRS